MSGHTPGPWSWAVQEQFFVVSDEGRIANVLFPSYTAGHDEVIANARLIAAAPDLLNALSVLADVAEERGIPCDAARAAIKKATKADRYQEGGRGNGI